MAAGRTRRSAGVHALHPEPLQFRGRHVVTCVGPVSIRSQKADVCPCEHWQLCGKKSCMRKRGILSSSFLLGRTPARSRSTARQARSPHLHLPGVSLTLLCASSQAYQRGPRRFAWTGKCLVHAARIRRWPRRAAFGMPPCPGHGNLGCAVQTHWTRAQCWVDGRLSTCI